MTRGRAAVESERQSSVPAVVAESAASRPAAKEALLRRLQRIEGQVRGVAKMVAEDRYCVDIMVQIGAIRSALDSLSRRMLETHTKRCVTRAIVGGKGDEALEEVLALLRALNRWRIDWDKPPGISADAIPVASSGLRFSLAGSFR